MVEGHAHALGGPNLGSGGAADVEDGERLHAANPQSKKRAEF